MDGTSSVRFGHRRVLAAFLAVAIAPSWPALAQERAAEGPDLAAREAQLEAAFAAAVELDEDTEPSMVLQTWGAVLLEATMLERARAMAASEDGSPPPRAELRAASERILARWQELRPDSGGPDLFRTFEIEDPDARLVALGEVLERYPHDPLVLSQAVQFFRMAGDAPRAREALEAFAARFPDRSLAYRMLAQDARDDQTRLADVLERWYRAIPEDPSLVSAWMTSTLPRQEPEATERVLRGFFAGRPAGDSALRACLDVMERGDPAYRNSSRACVARVAADPDAAPWATERATSALLGIAAAEGDWSSLLRALDTLEPGARVRALIAASGEIEKPARCAEALDLLQVASEALGDDADSYRALASALRACSERPEAQALYVSLLQSVPADGASRIVYAWVSRVNGVWRGELPEGAAGALERRLEREPGSPDLLAALDVVYQVAGEDETRFELLRRRQADAANPLDWDEAVALASGLLDRGEADEAMTILEEQVARRFKVELVDALWAVYLRAEAEERADRFAGRLIASGDTWSEKSGHLLAARSSLTRGDVAEAESHYWELLDPETEPRDLAVELLTAIGWSGDEERLEPTALRICEETRLGQAAAGAPSCAASLLSQAGRPDLASAVLSSGPAALPDDLESLRALASTAQQAGDSELEERARRHILELDPRSDGHWTGLALFLERQGRAEEVAGLLERARGVLSRPPVELYRAAGRALTAAGEPSRAIDLLLEARASLPDGQGGDWSRSWIDHELREAFRSLGSRSATVARADAPAPEPSFAPEEPVEAPAGETATELRLAADALHSGEGGRYDPVAAKELYTRAASLGDPLATLRLAVIRHLDGLGDDPSPEDLVRRSIPAVRALAEEGQGYAQYLVGTVVLMGIGSGLASPASARPWLEAAAAQGESWAWHNLAWMAETGQGLPGPDRLGALEAYRHASQAGNTRSMIAFARLAFTQGGPRELCDEGLRWLERSARAGNALAASTLGKHLFYGLGECVARDLEAARPWLEAGFATHQRGAIYDLGLALLLSGGEPTARRRGLSLLEKAAEEPSALAVETLALMRASGVGVRRDPDRARQLLAEAARLGSDGFPRLRQDLALSSSLRELIDEVLRQLEGLAVRGDAPAMALLARLYEQGFSRQGAEVEPERIVALARQAAEAGEASAMRILRNAYLGGSGVEKDEAEAFQWQRRCAEAGDSFCMMFLGNALMKGEGVEQDVVAGLAWLRRAGEAGNWWATADLGRLYDEGWYGMARDPDEAAVWKRRLADLGDPEATGWLVYQGFR